MNKIKDFEWEVSDQNERARILHLSKRLAISEGGKPDSKTLMLLQTIGRIDGVESLQPGTPYSLVILIGKCFDSAVVLNEVEEAAKAFLSDLVLPPTAKKLSLVP